jgi:hypothetical protein
MCSDGDGENAESGGGRSTAAAAAAALSRRSDQSLQLSAFKDKRNTAVKDGDAIKEMALLEKVIVPQQRKLLR